MFEIYDLQDATNHGSYDFTVEELRGWRHRRLRRKAQTLRSSSAVERSVFNRYRFSLALTEGPPTFTFSLHRFQLTHRHKFEQMKTEFIFESGLFFEKWLWKNGKQLAEKFDAQFGSAKETKKKNKFRAIGSTMWNVKLTSLVEIGNFSSKFQIFQRCRNFPNKLNDKRKRGAVVALEKGEKQLK